MIRPLTPRGLYKTLSLYSHGKTIVTTLYRVVWCTRKGVDIQKIPSDFCFSFDGKDIKVCERGDIVALAKQREKKEKEVSIAQAEKEFALIRKYIKGNRNPLFYKVNEITQDVAILMRRRYGLCEERAQMYAEIGRDNVLARFDDGGQIQIGLHRMIYCSARTAFISQRATEFKDWYNNIVLQE